MTMKVTTRDAMVASAQATIALPALLLMLAGAAIAGVLFMALQALVVLAVFLL